MYMYMYMVNCHSCSCSSCRQVNTEVSLFEFNIRFVGGFLSAYALSGEEVSGTEL